MKVLGLDIEEPEHVQRWTPIHAVIMAEFLDEDGDQRVVLMPSDGLTTLQLYYLMKIGMVKADHDLREWVLPGGRQ